MKKLSLVLLACAGTIIQSHAATNFAARVITYNPGSAFASGYTNPAAVLGEPSRVNPYEDATTPFNPAYGTAQILSIGEGGLLTVKFARPIYNTRQKPFGRDFLIFGNSGFIITNDYDPVTFDWLGVPATDGALFANNDGVTRVSVSRDGIHYFLLDTNEAPVVDGHFPTDGAGDFRQPVDPTASMDRLPGATLEAMRAIYNGSGGGTGYDISWARNRRGRKVRLPHIRFVRIEVVSGKAEVDGFSATVRHKSRD